MIRTMLTATLLCLTMTACSQTTKVEDELPESQTDTANPTGRTERVGSNPGERPVRIGEGGPRFDACQAVGKVSGLRSRSLDVLIAPFDSAEKKDSLPAGELVYICTRSHDQQWFGVVYGEAAPLAAAEEEGEAEATSPTGISDCGVSSPVRSKRNYDGPCKSGWVESTFVKLVAG